MFGEINYRHGDGPDIVVTDPRAAAFIEIGIGRPNVRDTIYRGDLSSYDDDVRKLILPRTEQLDRKIRHALDGDLPFHGAPTESLRRIHPVVCLMDGFPLGSYLYSRIKSAVEAEGHLQQPEAAPLSIISVQELEQLLGLVHQGRSMTDLLDRHAASPFNQEPLGEYLYATFGREIAQPPLLETAFADIARRFSAELLGPDVAAAAPF
jgi:hypothetical protein